MKLTIDDIKRYHDKAYNSGQITRERGADDLVFYHVTQWDDSLMTESQLQYRGEFNQLKKAGRQILSDLNENPIQVDFQPSNESRDDAAEIADGLYRYDDANNSSIEAYENAKQESVVTGYGAWKLYTKYITLRSGDRRQVIRRQPLYEANNTVFWDPNSRMLDKSDAMYVSCLRAFSHDGYNRLVKDLTGEELDSGWLGSFRNPEQSYVFPWIGCQGEKIYVTEFYYREKSTDNIFTMTDPFGMTVELREIEVKNAMDELLDMGYTVQATKTVDRYIVWKYIASGAKILSKDRIAGEHIPVVPIYGEHAIVEGEEHYEGITRIAKDPQRLRNFIMSYIADIVSRSPRAKPIFFPEQIKGFENMYIENGPDNNYPFLYSNRKAPDGSDLPVGPVAQMPDQPMPTALPPLLSYANEAIKDVADPGLPQNIADPDVSGKAVLALQARLDKQSSIYQQHFKHAKRRDGEIWASMASEIYDTPRKVFVVLPDGTRKSVDLMQAVIDEKTGEIVFLNDIRGVEFDVISRIGPDYKTQRQQTEETLMTLLNGMQPGDPMREVIMYKILQISDGIDLDDIRNAARKQLILKGIQDPETPEEQQMLIAAQNQPQPPSAEMVLAMAEDKKGQAALMKEQRETASLQVNTMNEITKRKIDAFKAQTERLDALIDSKSENVNIRNKDVETFGGQINNAISIQEIIERRTNRMMNAI